MKKKEYIKPQLQIVHISESANLLSGSGWDPDNGPDKGDENDETGDPQARQQDIWMEWD